MHHVNSIWWHVPGSYTIKNIIDCVWRQVPGRTKQRYLLSLAVLQVLLGTTQCYSILAALACVVCPTMRWCNKLKSHICMFRFGNHPRSPPSTQSPQWYWGLVLKSFLSKNRLKQLRHKGARNRVYQQLRSWQKLQSLLTDRQFHRYFRMSRECFALLANKIEQNVGAVVYKREEYLEWLKCDPNFPDALFNKQKNLLAAH